jgi:hypothetical protein
VTETERRDREDDTQTEHVDIVVGDAGEWFEKWSL